MRNLNNWLMEQSWFRGFAYAFAVLSLFAFIATPSGLTGFLVTVGLLASFQAYSRSKQKAERGQATSDITPVKQRAVSDTLAGSTEPRMPRTDMKVVNPHPRTKNIKYADWCPIHTVEVKFGGRYELVDGLDQQRLSRTLLYIDQKIGSEERLLRQAERSADQAHRNASIQKSRKTARHFSTRRSLQGIRHSFADMGSTMANASVQRIVMRINNLYQLRGRVEELLNITEEPSRDVPDPDQSGFCTSCGAPLLSDFAFCGSCGKKVPV